MNALLALSRAIDRMTERIAHGNQDEVAAHQRAVEGHLARLVEESARGRTAVADELRGEFRLLARTIASLRAGHPANEG